VKGITFGTTHTDDLGLILGKKEIGSPTVKENKVDIPGADGSLDMTDFFGEPKYENVKHKFEFSALVPVYEEAPALFSRVKNALHGRKLRIILDDDPAFFYVGRCHVSSYTDEKGIGKLTIECDCEPYKYRLDKTTVTRAIDGTDMIVLANGRKRAVPTITTTEAMTIIFGSGTWTTSAGTFAIPELELVEGANLVEVIGTGIITFTWQDGES
jgi:phage-related protein